MEGPVVAVAREVVDICSVEEVVRAAVVACTVDDVARAAVVVCDVEEVVGIGQELVHFCATAGGMGQFRLVLVISLKLLGVILP